MTAGTSTAVIKSFLASETTYFENRNEMKRSRIIETLFGQIEAYILKS